MVHCPWHGPMKNFQLKYILHDSSSKGHAWSSKGKSWRNIGQLSTTEILSQKICIHVYQKWVENWHGPFRMIKTVFFFDMIHFRPFQTCGLFGPFQTDFAPFLNYWLLWTMTNNFGWFFVCRFRSVVDLGLRSSILSSGTRCRFDQKLVVQSCHASCCWWKIHLVVFWSFGFPSSVCETSLLFRWWRMDPASKTEAKEKPVSASNAAPSSRCWLFFANFSP